MKEKFDFTKPMRVLSTDETILVTWIQKDCFSGRETREAMQTTASRLPSCISTLRGQGGFHFSVKLYCD